MKRYEVTTKTNRISPNTGASLVPLVVVSENHKNPDGKVVTFPAFSLSVEDAQELMAGLGQALAEVEGDRLIAKRQARARTRRTDR